MYRGNCGRGGRRGYPWECNRHSDCYPACKQTSYSTGQDNNGCLRSGGLRPVVLRPGREPMEGQEAGNQRHSPRCPEEIVRGHSEGCYACPSESSGIHSIPGTGVGAFSLANTVSLVALPVGGLTGKPELIQCTYNGQAEAATNDLPYIAIGSGQPIADPHLALLRRVFWPDKLPNIADGIFAAMWTLLHAIQVNPGGVAEPIQMAVLEKSKGNELRAHEFSWQVVAEHRQHVKEAEEHLRSFSDSQHASSTQPPDAPGSTP